MMATRKILSVLTVLLLITSGMALTAFASGPLPDADTEGATEVGEDVFVIPEPSTPEDEGTNGPFDMSVTNTIDPKGEERSTPSRPWTCARRS